jgi:hypothetical protein
MTKNVYLGGPIGGLTWHEANSWRNSVTSLLAPLNCLSPLRPLNGVSQFDCNPTFNEHVNDDQVLPFHVFHKRDYEDVDSSQMLLFNFIGAKRKSIGSACEIARGYYRQTPMVCVMELGNINEDVFLLAHFQNNVGNTCRVHTLQEGVNAIRQFFGLPVYETAAD